VAPRHGARIEMTAARAALASSSPTRRQCESSRLGVVLAFLALLAQVAGPGLHGRALTGPANGGGKLSFDFGAHALCLAANDAAPVPAPPADKAPKTDHDFAACCFWHGSVGAVVAPAALVEPVAFAASRVAFAALLADIPSRVSGTARARAPPAGA